MAKTIHFTKMHGAGNDYIYVNTLLYPIADPEAAARIWSQPHMGIGSDGLVLIGKPTTQADYRMRIFNADGSEAMMCGNASRCIGKYLFEKGLTDKKHILLETLSGIKTLELNVDEESRKVESVTVDMLEPRFDVPEQFAPSSPVDAETASTPLIRHTPTATETTVGGLKGTFVSMGNPHFVIFTDNIQEIDVEKLGRKMEFDTAFPQRCNIEFAQVTGENQVRMRVWERGSGITMACGTGACATAVAAAKTGRCGNQSNIVMDGGTLTIEWRPADNHVYMTGPATFAFEGEIDLPATTATDLNTK